MKSKKIKVKLSNLLLIIILLIAMSLGIVNCDNSIQIPEYDHTSEKQITDEITERSSIIPTAVSYSWTTSTVRQNLPTGYIYYSGYYSKVYLEKIGVSTTYKTTISGTGSKNYSCTVSTAGNWRIKVVEYASSQYVSFTGRWYSGTYTLSTKYGSTVTISEINSLYPNYYPGWWLLPNDNPNDPRTRNSNNCYSYACNKDLSYSTFGEAQPGRGSNKIYTEYLSSMTLKEALILAAENDGLTYLGENFQHAGSGKALVALICENEGAGTDYHFYRLDNNGYWSHKPGDYSVRNVDYDGNLIPANNLQNAAFDPKYGTWVGYFEIDTSGTEQGAGTESIG